MLSDLQLDALTEVFNIGAGRAAESLSEIVGDTVLLSVPSIEILENKDIDAARLGLENDEFAAVSQIFSGPFDAEGLLLFTETHALEIVREMMGSEIAIEDLPEFEQEAMCEVGNIILNACLSAMADIFGIQLDSGLPRYSQASPQWILRYVSYEMERDCLLVLHIDLKIEKRQTQGHLIFFLSTDSLNQLVEHVQRYLDGIQ
ncbi:chemotaxis protein CheC [Oxalobacteraceae bacterium CAVE-383]|nr:chemotaxis protein CheC [Oxalobacteraceae bacterium CAVE-383]